jgi:hypothetical protein
LSKLRNFGGLEGGIELPNPLPEVNLAVYTQIRCKRRIIIEICALLGYYYGA